jgi:diadenosine tetraphosphate (Ap4A) HIT family hydrolase
VVNDTDSPAEPTVFTRIIRGELPGRFLWREDDVVAFLTIAPIRPGHTLVVPVAQVDRWTDLDPEVWVRVCEVTHEVGRAIQQAFEPTRVGSIIAGMEVPHCHVHLIPIDDERQLDFSLADPSTSADELDRSAVRIRAALRDLDGGASVPPD